MKGMLGASKSLLVTLFALLGLVVPTGLAGAATPQYMITDLGSLGGPACWAGDINALGQVVGSATTAGGDCHAFLWESGVGMRDLGALGGATSRAYGINDAGQVVGEAHIASGLGHAFLWEDGVGMLDLGTLGGDESKALCLNEDGVVFGWAQIANGERYSFLYSSDKGLVRFAKISDHIIGSWVCGIYSHTVVGTVQLENGVHRGFYWPPGLLLGTLGGDCSYACGVNASLQIVGYSDTASGETHAFLREGAVMHDLTALSDDSSYAYAINNEGQVVGSVGSHAFLWHDEAMWDLNDLIPADSGWILSTATAINNFGRIVGVGNHNGEEHIFLLTPLVVIHPHTATIQKGHLISGDVQSVAASDDTYHVVKVDRDSRRHIVEVHYTGTSPILSPSSLDFRYEGVSSFGSRPDPKVYIYNHTSSEWDKVNPTIFRGTENTWTCSIETDVGRYVNSITGEVKCKVCLTGANPRSSHIGSDLVEWIVSP